MRAERLRGRREIFPSKRHCRFRCNRQRVFRSKRHRVRQITLDISRGSDIIKGKENHPEKHGSGLRRALCVHQREPPRRAFFARPACCKRLCIAGHTPPPPSARGERAFLFCGTGAAKYRAPAAPQAEEGGCPETRAGTARYSRLRVTPHFARNSGGTVGIFAHPV